MSKNVLSRLPIADQEKYELAMARNQILESVKPDLNELSRSVRENLTAQIESLPQEDTAHILKELQKSPASQVIEAIQNGAFSRTDEKTKKKNRFNLGNAIVSLVSGMLKPDEEVEVSRTKRGVASDINIKGPSHRSPGFSAKAEASQSKASAISHDPNSRSGARTYKNGGRAMVEGRGIAASSTTTVTGKVSFTGSETNFGNVDISNKD